MKRVHLFRVNQPVESFARLIESAAAAGLRVGWLELQEPTLPTEVARQLETGIAQVVVAGERRTLTARARRGPAVLADLLRQHFLGCDLVLVAGELSLPALDAVADGWRLAALGGEERVLATDQLLAELRRPVAAALPG